MLVRFFHVLHNTQMLNIKYAYLMIFLDQNGFKSFWIRKLKKIDYEKEIEEK
jgi:hypothetical protein